MHAADTDGVDTDDAARRRVSRIASHINASSSTTASKTRVCRTHGGDAVDDDVDDDDAHARRVAALTTWLARHPPHTALDVTRTPRIVIDQARIDAFASCTDDDQWIHRATAPGGAVAHGFLTLSLLTTLTAPSIANDWARKHINYGLDRVRFIAPVRVNDVVFLRALECARADALPRDAGARVRYLATIAVARHARLDDDSDGHRGASDIHDACVVSWITAQYV